MSKVRGYPVLLSLMTAGLLVTVLVMANLWNPWPQVTTWWGHVTALSKPGPVWESRADGVPDLATVLPSGQAIVESRGFVQAYDAATGKPLWRYNAYWALPGGDVVVIHQRSTNPDQDNERDRGYSVVDPASGVVIWGEHEAKAVWVYADTIVDLSCPDPDACLLRARAHRDNGKALWSVTLPGSARTVLGAAPGLAGTRDPAGWFDKAAKGTPGELPPVIGIEVSDRIEVIDTVDGRLVREVSPPDRQTRVAVAGDRVLLSGAAPSDSTCRFWLDAMNARSGQTQWHLDGFDLNTSDGGGCEQRRDPLGAAGELVAVGPDNNPVLLAANTGAKLWVGSPGDRVLSTDGELLVVQLADRKTIRVFDLIADGRPVVWSEQMGLKVEAAVTQTLVIIRDADKGRIVVLGHRPVSKLADVKTTATVVGYGPSGLLLVSGRRIGFIPLTG